MHKVLTLALLTVAAAVPASAQLITPSPITAVGTCWGVNSSFALTFNTALDRLTIDVNNNLAGGAAGRLTAFVIDLPAFDDVTPFDASTVSILSTTGTTASDWSDFGTAAQDLNVNGLAFNFDLGVGTGANVNGGGGNGILNGQTAQFVIQFSFDLTASYVTSVQNYYSSHQGAFLGARWQDVNGVGVTGGSDAGLDILPPDDAVVPSVPEPSTYGLIGVGALLALVTVRARRR